MTNRDTGNPYVFPMPPASGNLNRWAFDLVRALLRVKFETDIDVAYVGFEGSDPSTSGVLAALVADLEQAIGSMVQQRVEIALAEMRNLDIPPPPFVPPDEQAPAWLTG